MIRRSRLWLAVALVVFVASGANCPWYVRTWGYPPPPAVLSASPTLDEIVAVVNGNSQRVQSLSAGIATVSGSGFPSLRANLAIERPQRFRLRAASSFTGPEMDLGSNDEVFWLWLKRSDPKAMYFCRHDRFAGSAMQRIVPLTPEQIVNAFGLTTFDPRAQHQGPFRSAPGRLQIRSVIDGPEGPLTKTTTIDDRQGVVLEQSLYNARGTHLATVKTSRHRFDPTARVTLPHTIELDWPTAKLSISINVDRYAVNQPVTSDTWTRPEVADYPNVDLADPNRMAPSEPRAAAPGRAAGSAPLDREMTTDGRRYSRYGDPPVESVRRDRPAASGIRSRKHGRAGRRSCP